MAGLSEVVRLSGEVDRCRIRKLLSRFALARRAGLSLPCVMRALRGEPVRLLTAEKLLAALDMSAEEGVAELPAARDPVELMGS